MSQGPQNGEWRDGHATKLAFSERVGDSKRWAGFARLASVLSTGLGAAALAVIAWQAIKIIDATERNAAALHHIDLFVQEAQDIRQQRDQQITSINGDLISIHSDISQLRSAQADQNTRLRCLENNTRCPP